MAMTIAKAGLEEEASNTMEFSGTSLLFGSILFVLLPRNLSGSSWSFVIN
jgi:hypothetical protein